MAEITRTTPYSQTPYKFIIAGDNPTADEQLRIDSILRQQEAQFMQDAAYYGVDASQGEGSGFGNQVGEFFKGIPAGAVNMAESAGLGLAAMLPEDSELKARELIRRGAIAARKPFAPDIGLEDSIVGQIGQGLGSFAPLVAASFLGGPVGAAAATGMAVGAGTGEASERARAAGATLEERNAALPQGAAIGATEMLPVSFIKFLGLGAAKGVFNRIARAAAEGGTEAAQEAAAEALQNAVEMGYNPNQTLGEGLVPAAGVGFSAGAIVQALVDFAIRDRGPRVTPPEVDAEAAPSPADVLALPAPGPRVPQDVSPGTQGNLFDDDVDLGKRPAVTETEGGVTEQDLADIGAQLELPLGLKQDIVDTVDQAIAEEARKGRPATVEQVAPKVAKKARTKGKRKVTPQEVVNTYTEATQETPQAPVEAPKAASAEVQADTQEAPVAAAAPAPEASEDLVSARESLAAQLEAKSAELWGFNRTKPVDSGPNIAEDTRAIRDSVEEIADATPADADAGTITTAVLDSLGVPKGAAVYKATQQGKAPQGDLRTKLGTFAVRTKDAEVAGRVRDYLTSLDQGGDRGSVPSDTLGDERPGGGDVSPTGAAAPRREGLAVSGLGVPEGAGGAVGGVDTLERNAAPGAVSGAAGQVIPAPAIAEPSPFTPKPATRFNPKTQRVERVRERTATEQEIDAASQAREAKARVDAAQEFAEWRAQNVPANVRKHSRDVAEDLGEIEDITTARDKMRIVEIVKGRRAWDFSKEMRPTNKYTQEYGEGAFEAARYFLRDANPMHTLELVAYDYVYGAQEANQSDTDQDAELDKIAKSGRNAARKLLVTKAPYKGPQGIDKTSATYLYNIKTGQGIAANAVRWMREYMSPEAKAYLDETINEHKAQLAKDVERYAKRVGSEVDPRRTLTAKEVAKRELSQALRGSAATYNMRVEAERGNVSLPPAPENLKFGPIVEFDRTAELTKPVHPSVSAALRAGDLVGALQAMAYTSQDPHVRRLAMTLSNFVGDTRVYVEGPGQPAYDEFLAPRENHPGNDGVYMFTDRHGRGTALKYANRNRQWRYFDFADAYSNAIILAEGKTSNYLILHEAMHMVTANVLQKSSHPTTKALQKLFDDMEPQIENDYGGTDVWEFVAEAFSDPAFRAKLAQFQPKGETVNGLQRFFRAVANLFRSILGKTPKKPDSVLDEVDRLVSEIMAPAPNVSDAGMRVFYRRDSSIDGLKEVFGRAAPFGINEGKHVAAAMVSGVPDGVKSFTLGFVPLRNLVDMAKGVFGERVEGLINIANGMSAELRGIHERIDHTLKHTTDWIKDNRNLLDTFNTVRFMATLNEVDPGKPRSHYKDSPQKLETWDKLQSMWRSLGRGGQAEFYRMAGMFEYMRGEAQKALKARIHSMEKDYKKAESIYKTLEGKIFSKHLIDPYAPLQRSGKYWLTYTAIDPVHGNREVFKHSFDSMAERQRAMNQLDGLKDEYGIEDVESYTNVRELFTREAPPAKFVRDLMDTLKTSGVDASVQTDVMDLVLDLIPERSFLNSFRAREGVRGFEGDITPLSFGKQGMFDAVRYSHQRASSMARQIARMKYGAEASRIRSDLHEAYKGATKNSQAQTDYVDQLYFELDRRAKAITGMNRGDLSRKLTGGLFFMTLGFNLSSAAVNMFALPTMVYGYVGPKYGFAKTARASAAATKLIAASGRTRTIEKVGPDGKVYSERAEGGVADYSFSNYDFDAAGNEKIQHLKYLAEIAGERNQLHRSLVFEMAEIDETTSTADLGSRWEKVRAASGSIFHHSERYAREVTLLTTYQLELEKMANGRDITKLTPEQYKQAAEAAVYTAELTNGSIAATAAPRWAQTDAGAVFLLYKRYALSMIGLQATMFNQAFRDADPETRRVAKLQLASTYGLLAAFSGVAGVPLYGLISDIWNLLLADDDEENFDTMTRKALGELGYRGVLNYVSGREVGSRIGLNDMIFRESTVDQPFMMDLLVGYGGPAVGIFNNSIRGLGLISQGEVERGVEAMVPAFVRSIMRSARYGIEGTATTLRGDPIIDDIGVADIVGQLMGFAPTKYVQQLEINSQYKRMDKAIADERSRLMKQLYMAMRERNYSEARRIREDIVEFNQKHPQYPIKPENLKRSLDQHEETSRTMVGGVTYNPANRDKFLQMQRGWSEPTFWGG